MIVVSPQLTDWVYAAGYSAGGETMSRVMGERAQITVSVDNIDAYDVIMVG